MQIIPATPNLENSERCRRGSGSFCYCTSYHRAMGMTMARHAKTLRIIEAAGEVLAEQRPMTVRQVYYQLVSRQVIKNTRSQYQAVSNALVAAHVEVTRYNAARRSGSIRPNLLRWSKRLSCSPSGMQAVTACRQAVEGLRRDLEDFVEALTKEEVIV